jgi:hypothetical protein
MKVARRGRDAKLLTDVYSATAIYFTKDALLLRGRTLNLSDGAVEDVAEKLLLTDVASATLEPYEYRVTITNKRREVAVARGVELQLKDREGRLLYRAPVPNDMDAEALCQSVMKKH